MSADELTNACHDARKRFNSLPSMFLRFSDIKTNLRSISRALSFWRYAAVSARKRTKAWHEVRPEMNQGLRVPVCRAGSAYAAIACAVVARVRTSAAGVTVWLVPILGLHCSGVGTNVCKVWEFDVVWSWGASGRIMVSYSAVRQGMLAWIVHGHHAVSLADLCRCLHSGLRPRLLESSLRDQGAAHRPAPGYNQPWANNEGREAIALDYSPWFFGGFGFSYGAFIGAIELYIASGNPFGASEFIVFSATGLILCIAFPVLGFHPPLPSRPTDTPAPARCQGAHGRTWLNSALRLPQWPYRRPACGLPVISTGITQYSPSGFFADQQYAVCSDA